MERIIERCAGLDVHKSAVTACVRISEESGTLRQEIREFATTTRGLLLLRDWLASLEVRLVGMEREIVKAVAGFMNAQGGTLLIGVDDDHQAVGLQNDYKLTKKGNRDPRDSFENWLTDLFDTCVGKPALANVAVSFESVDGHDVCRVEVRPSRQPVYARGKQSMDFYVRLNNGSRSLDIEEAVAYISVHDWVGG